MSSLQKCLTMFVYGGCNLACKYCYSSSSHTDTTINMAFARAGIDDFFNRKGEKQLRIFGVGEPTLAIDRVMEIVDYARKCSDTPIKIELQSNGYFGDHAADWIERNIDILWLSSDGPADIHDLYRPTKNGRQSSQVVYNNIRRFLSSSQCKLGVRATITAETCRRQAEIVEFFAAMGVKYISADPVFLPVGETSSGSTVRSLLIEDPDSYANAFLSAVEVAHKFGISYSSILTVNAGLKSKYGCRGCFTNPHLTVDGAVTCCDMAFTKATPLTGMLWGFFDESAMRIQYDKDRIKGTMARCVNNLPACSKCIWKYECSGGCFGEALNETGNMYAVKEFSCRATKSILPRLSAQRAGQQVCSLGHP